MKNYNALGIRGEFLYCASLESSFQDELLVCKISSRLLLPIAWGFVNNLTLKHIQLMMYSFIILFEQQCSFIKTLPLQGLIIIHIYLPLYLIVYCYRLNQAF